MSKSAEQKKRERKQRERELARKQEAKKKEPPKPPQRPKSVREALGVKPLRTARVEDLTEFQKKNDLGINTAEKVAAKPSSPLSQLAPDASPDEKAYFEAAESVDKLMTDVPAIRKVVGSMLATRRLYATFYRELQEILEGQKNVHPMAEDFMVQAAMHKAAEPFSEHELMQGFVETMLPYIAEIIDKHSAKDAEDERQRRESWEEERRSRRIPIGFKYSATQELDGLGRDRALVLVGWAPALYWLTDQIINNVLTKRDSDNYQIIRFMHAAPHKTDREQSRLVRVPPANWAGCGNSQNDLARVMGEFVQDRLSAQPDLVIVDDLAAAYTKGFVSRLPAANAGDANKVFSRWCNLAGSALIGLLPIDSMELPDIRSGEYEQLRTFTNLRPVSVEKKDEGQLRITVGDRAASFEVHSAIVEAYARSKIIIPNA